MGSHQHQQAHVWCSQLLASLWSQARSELCFEADRVHGFHVGPQSRLPDRHKPAKSPCFESEIARQQKFEVVFL